MLNPEVIVNALLATIKTIAPLATALGPDPLPPQRPRISAFHFAAGVENPLSTVILQVPTPGLLVCWTGTVGGKFDGSDVWKHKFEIYIRSGNMADAIAATGPGYLWWLLMTQPVNGGTNNIRSSNAIMPQLELMDLPQINYRRDAQGLDYWIVSMVIPEIFDDPS